MSSRVLIVRTNILSGFFKKFSISGSVGSVGYGYSELVNGGDLN